MSHRDGAGEPLDLAVIGAGVAGAFVARQVLEARPEWSVCLFERHDRIGGRLRSVRLPGLDHPVELGGMRFLTSHRRVVTAVEAFGLATHPFDETGGAERSYLRGVFGLGASDPAAGAGYDLSDDERGRSAGDLLVAAFEAIVPGARALSAGDWRGLRRTARYGDRPLTDWTVGDALATVLSAEGHRFVTDAFGYDSGLRFFNLGDAVEYLLGAGDPTAVARVPDDGMDAIPRALVRAFEATGGNVRLGSELRAIAIADGVLQLDFADGASLASHRVVLALPVPALRLVTDASPALDTPAVHRPLASVELVSAAKLYLVYEAPWWLDEPAWVRLTTDLPNRKVFSFGRDPNRSAALLAAYTDARHSEAWLAMALGHEDGGSPAPAPMVAAAERALSAAHPGRTPLPRPLSSAFSAWGADPHETGWHFWAAGARSDDIIDEAVKPIPGLELYVCGDAFSRAQGWAEGALESAERVVSRLTT